MITLGLKGQNPEHNLEQAHRHCMHNRLEIEASQTCGCFYCRALFAPSAIQEWWDDDDSAVCPVCGIDAVLGNSSGFPITPDFMDKMHERWF